MHNSSVVGQQWRRTTFDVTLLLDGVHIQFTFHLIHDQHHTFGVELSVDLLYILFNVARQMKEEEKRSRQAAVKYEFKVHVR